MKNKNGVEVKVCCASCIHRRVKEKGRFCRLDNSPVASGHSCISWRMDPRLQNAGNGNGVVRNIVTKEVILQ